MISSVVDFFRSFVLKNWSCQTYENYVYVAVNWDNLRKRFSVGYYVDF